MASDFRHRMAPIPYGRSVTGWRVEPVGLSADYPGVGLFNSITRAARIKEATQNTPLAPLEPTQLIGDYLPATGVAHAQCACANHVAPDPNCNCGFRVVDDIDALVYYYTHSFPVLIRDQILTYMPEYQRFYDTYHIYVEVRGYGVATGPDDDDPQEGCICTEYIELTGNARLYKGYADRLPVIVDTYPMLTNVILYGD